MRPNKLAHALYALAHTSSCAS